jgi:hypothetical protein
MNFGLNDLQIYTKIYMICKIFKIDLFDFQ